MNRIIIALLIVVSLESMGSAFFWAEENRPANEPAIHELIKKLGSSKFAERERAAKQLEAIGERALQALRDVAKSADAGQAADLETTRRAAEILRRLEEKISNAKILAPRRLRLNIKDASVLDAIKELEKLSGYAIQIQGDRNALASRRITLDTGETTFWEALDQLCQKGGLVESNQQPAPMPPSIRSQPRPAPILPVKPPARPVPPPVLNKVQLQAPVAIAAVDVVELPAVPARPARPIQAKPVPAPVQIQAAPVQLRRARIQPIYPAPATNQIQVMPGKPSPVPTSYAGAVRVRAFTEASSQKGEAIIRLDASAEPRLQNFSLSSSPRIDRAIDDEGQTLTFVMDPAQFANTGLNNPYGVSLPRQARIQFKVGDKRSESLKELSGSLTAQAVMPTETLVSVPDIMQAAGKTAKGADGASLTVASVQKQANGDIQVQVRMENIPGQNPFGANGIVIQQIQINVQGGGNVVIGGMPLNPNSGMPVLVDKAGKSFSLVNIPNRRLQVNNGMMSQEASLVFRPNAGQGDPDRLILTGQRTATFAVPFSFKNVPLP